MTQTPTPPDAALVRRVCEVVRDAHGDLEELTDDAIRRLAPLATVEQQGALRAASLAQMAGLAELDPFVSDPTIDEVLINGDRVWVDRNGQIEAVGALTAITVEQVIERILAPIGRRVDRTTPIVDARLANGARVCAVVAPVAIGGSTLSIRRFATEVRSLVDFTDDVGVALVAELVDHRCNVVVCGATSSGKTSLLASLLTLVDDRERILIIEDTAELATSAPHIVRLEARPGTVEGLAPISLSELVRTALRLRPDRLVVGEVRGDEVLGLVQAMNTGHDGSFSTCHANGPLDALLRLESLVLQAAPQWPLPAVRQQLARSIDVIVNVGRAGQHRRISSIDEVVAPDLSGDLRSPAIRNLAVADDSGRLRRTGSLHRGRR